MKKLNIQAGVATLSILLMLRRLAPAAGGVVRLHRSGAVPRYVLVRPLTVLGLLLHQDVMSVEPAQIAQQVVIIAVAQHPV